MNPNIDYIISLLQDNFTTQMLALIPESLAYNSLPELLDIDLCIEIAADLYYDPPESIRDIINSN